MPVAPHVGLKAGCGVSCMACVVGDKTCKQVGAVFPERTCLLKRGGFTVGERCVDVPAHSSPNCQGKYKKGGDGDVGLLFPIASRVQWQENAD